MRTIFTIVATYHLWPVVVEITEKGWFFWKKHILHIELANGSSFTMPLVRIAQEASRQKAAEDLSRRLNDADQYANTRFPGVVPDGWPQ